MALYATDQLCAFVGSIIDSATFLFSLNIPVYYGRAQRYDILEIHVSAAWVGGEGGGRGVRVSCMAVAVLLP